MDQRPVLLRLIGTPPTGDQANDKDKSDDRSRLVLDRAAPLHIARPRVAPGWRMWRGVVGR
jgi:hypothetical protein